MRWNWVNVGLWLAEMNLQEGVVGIEVSVLNTAGYVVISDEGATRESRYGWLAEAQG